MSDISTLKEKINLKTFHFLLLVTLSAGLYAYYWIYKTLTAIEDVTRIKTMSQAYLMCFLILSGMGGALLNIDHPTFQLVGSAMIICTLVLNYNWLFRVRRALMAYALAEHNFELRMNLVYTVLFSYYYVNYCINDLPKAKQKHQDKQRLDQDSVQA